MKISRGWLEQFIDLTGITDGEIASRLTMLGIEIESFENLSEKYKGFVVGSVLEVARHPNADRLSLCKVDVGTEVKSIVCGAPNVAAGQKVPVGLIGAFVPHNQHDPDGRPSELTRVKIRGVESEGMICSANELDLGDDKTGIMVLSEDAKTGTSLSQCLGLDDTIFEVSLTPNRADCLSHLGIARELASAFAKKLKRKRLNPRESEQKVAQFAKVDVTDADLCPRYSARIIMNVKIAPSPRWLKTSLEIVGMRSINNVVDATNYVMLELGQPLHAFDLDLLKRKHVVVRRPKAEEKVFVTLDGKERNIDPDMLMICDSEKIIAIAGVMGGMNSEINSETRNILIESANFTPSSIRRTSKKLGLSTEASYRFERGVDPNLTLASLDRVAEIIKEISPEGTAEVAGGIIDVASTKFSPKRMELHVENVNKLLGTRLASGEIKRYLDSIEIITDKKSETILTCSVPTFRGDIDREADLIEEVARVHGYDRIDEALHTRLIFEARFKRNDTLDDLKNFLSGAGFTEIITNSLQPAEIASMFALNHVAIANPISEEMAAMRTSLLPGTLETITQNLSYGTKDMKFYEVGRVFALSELKQKVGNFVEIEKFSLCLTGKADPMSFDRKESKFDIFDLKSEIGRVLEHLNLDSWDFISYDKTKEYEQSLKLIVEGVEVGIAGRVSSNILRKFAIEQDVYFAELDAGKMVSANSKIRFRPLPKFPFASIDLAFFVNIETKVGDIVESLRTVAGKLAKDISVFDIYSGEGVPQGKKSVALTISLGSDERTLDDSDIARFIEDSDRALGRKFSATLRKKTGDDLRQQNPAEKN